MLSEQLAGAWEPRALIQLLVLEVDKLTEELAALRTEVTGLKDRPAAPAADWPTIQYPEVAEPENEPVEPVADWPTIQYPEVVEPEDNPTTHVADWSAEQRDDWAGA